MHANFNKLQDQLGGFFFFFEKQIHVYINFNSVVTTGCTNCTVNYLHQKIAETFSMGGGIGLTVLSFEYYLEVDYPFCIHKMI